MLLEKKKKKNLENSGLSPGKVETQIQYFR